MTRRRWIVLHVTVILLITYVSSYFYISRRRWEEAARLKSPAFLYVAAERALHEPEESWLPEHYALAYFYMPINALDRDLLGGPSPIMCFFHIGKKKGAE